MNKDKKALRMQKKYYALSEKTICEFLSNHQGVSEFLGGDYKSWNVREVGDGNLNLVFIIEGAKNSLCAKQALPYVRLVGESWPLSLRRAHFEYLALTEQAKNSNAFVPKIHLYLEDMALIVMDFLTPHIILRKGMIAGEIYPKLSHDIGTFLADSLYFTSDYYLTANEKRDLTKNFLDNHDLCNITENLIFDEPYFQAEMNKHNSPFLDKIVDEIQNDNELKKQAQKMKAKFLNSKQALLHGDLHSGSVMVTPNSTKIIDPEFALVGPIAFDIGMFLGNLIKSYFSQEGYENREDYKIWILQLIEEIWSVFSKKFQENFINHQNGDLYKPHLCNRQDIIGDILSDILQDSLKFAGCEIIRRIIGLAHVADFEEIKILEKRANCEENALILGKWLLKSKESLTIEGVIFKMQEI